jgi:hypothetical protein
VKRSINLTEFGIRKARQEIDISSASPLLHQRSLIAIGLPYLKPEKEHQNSHAAVDLMLSAPEPRA